MTYVPILPNSIRTRTGATTVPNAPIGSRKNIFSSSQTSLQSPRIIYLIPNGVAGDLDENILEVGQNCAEFADTKSILGETPDDAGDEILAVSLDCEFISVRRDVSDLRHRAKEFLRAD